MHPPRTRREVLRAAGGLGVALALPGAAACAARTAAAAPEGGEPLFRISLAQWSLHRALEAGRLDPLDFPRVAREEHGLEGVEYVNTFFREKAGDYAWLGDLKRRAADLGVRSLLIMIDAEGDLADADEDARRRAIERHFRWIAAAGFLGCHSIRVNAAGTGSREEQLARAADSLHRLAGMAGDYGISVIVENHGGLSSDGAWLAEVMRRADHPGVGTLPDFGNFQLGGGEHYDRYRGVRELMPYARAVSAKSYAFDATGEETTIDYHRMLRIVVEAGYRGWVGIEYEGDGLEERQGIQRTKALLERVRAELAGGMG